MRKSLFFILALACTLGYAQNKQILYGFQEVPQQLMLNPGAKVPQRMHFGIPFLSQIHLNGGATGVTVFDIFGNEGGDINDRIRNKIFEMDSNDYFTARQQLELINFGWRAENEIYFSGGIYQEFDFITYFPRDLAILAWDGNRDYLDYEFDLGQLSTTADLHTVFHFGANKQLTKKLTAGARVKVYSSILSIRSVNNKGTFVTSLSDGITNIYDHTINNAAITVNTSGIASLDGLEGNEVAGKLLGRAFLGGSLGLGLDLGVTYDWTSKITVSASVLDAGAIFHTRDAESYEANGSYTLNGIELIFPPLTDGDAAIPYYDNLEDEIENEIPIDTITSGYTQFRPLQMNAAAEYSFGKILGGGKECDCRNMGAGVDRQQKAGIQLYSIFRPKGPQLAATLFYYRRIWEFLSAKATYTADPYGFSNVGIGLAVDAGKFNFYIAGDNLLRYGNIAKAKNVSLQLGFNIKIDEE